MYDTITNHILLTHIHVPTDPHNSKPCMWGTCCISSCFMLHQAKLIIQDSQPEMLVVVVIIVVVVVVVVVVVIVVVW